MLKDVTLWIVLSFFLLAAIAGAVVPIFRFFYGI